MSTNNAAHTPGPWIAVQHSNRSRAWRVTRTPDDAHGDVANILGGLAAIDNEQVAANAHLIAAAPELLGALQILLPGLVLDLRYADDDDDKEAMRARVETVTTAIAKATGSAK